MRVQSKRGGASSWEPSESSLAFGCLARAPPLLNPPQPTVNNRYKPLTRPFSNICTCPSTPSLPLYGQACHPSEPLLSVIVQHRQSISTEPTLVLIGHSVFPAYLVDQSSLRARASPTTQRPLYACILHHFRITDSALPLTPPSSSLVSDGRSAKTLQVP